MKSVFWFLVFFLICPIWVFSLMALLPLLAVILVIAALVLVVTWARATWEGVHDSPR
jgi:hypothetical protein